jgi:hypothetical protein
MKAYRARTLFSDPEHDQSVIEVHSSLSQYRVVVKGDDAFLHGPGITSEGYDLTARGWEKLSHEAVGLMCAITWEEEE